MTGYTILRLVHAWWRWAVLAAAVVVLVRAIAGLRGKGEWSKSDERASLLFVSAVDVQILLGLVLYFGFSPYFTAVHASFHAAMKDAATRFFAVEHETAMVLAAVAAHVGRVRARRAKDARRKHRAMLTAVIIFLVLVLAAVPWPWRSFGRPLFRTSL
jgi:uncharacterized membrane protein (UPF0182 family)